VCLAIPMQLISRRELDGTAELGGVRRTVSLMLCPEAAVGDHVLVHAGFAIGRIDAGEAAATLALIDEGIAREQQLDAGRP
jgi:hydrogenase expression/formation protein HypC